MSVASLAQCLYCMLLISTLSLIALWVRTIFKMADFRLPLRDETSQKQEALHTP